MSINTILHWKGSMFSWENKDNSKRLRATQQGLTPTVAVPAQMNSFHHAPGSVLCMGGEASFTESVISSLPRCPHPLSCLRSWVRLSSICIPCGRTTWSPGKCLQSLGGPLPPSTGFALWALPGPPNGLLYTSIRCKWQRDTGGLIFAHLACLSFGKKTEANKEWTRLT